MFGLNALEDLYKNLVDSSYTFCNINNLYKYRNNRRIFLRHDIDCSLKYAYEVAKIEKNLGITSNYFFMINSSFYNIFTSESKKLINNIKGLNHDISLHIDANNYNDLNNDFKFEKNIFEDIFNVDIKIISIHRPGKFLDNNNRLIGSCLHTYQDEFFREMLYLSDSACRDIRDKLNSICLNPPTKCLHLLIHPIWWIRQTDSPTASVLDWINDLKESQIKEMEQQCRSFKIE